MTVNECKKDLARRLAGAGVACARMSAKTVSFEGLGYGCCVFVKIHRPVWTTEIKHLGDLKRLALADVPKPSEGGYCVETDDGGFQ